MDSRYKTLLVIIIMGVMNVYSQALYIPNHADSQNTGESIDSLVLGRKLYVNNCASCHTLHKSEEFTKNEWSKVMLIMQKKAKSNNADTQLILKYLKARSKQEK